MIIIGSSPEVRSVWIAVAVALAVLSESNECPLRTTDPAASCVHSPDCFSTRRCCSVGIWAAASSAIGFIAQNFPRRYVPSAVKSAFASASFSRETIAAAPKPENSGRKIPPILMMASIAITISGTIGMKTPMASPLPRPRLRRAAAILFVCSRNSL